MGFYRKKPVVVEAIQWTGDNEKECIDFMGEAAFAFLGLKEYVIRHNDGTFHAETEDDFNKTYEKI